MIKMKLSVNSRLQVAKYSCQEHAIGYEIYVENYYKFHITIYTNGIMVTSRWRSLKPAMKRDIAVDWKEEVTSDYFS